jgi:hypothetical protein
MICDPALTALFTPLHPRVGRYEVCVTTDAIEEVIADRSLDGARHTYSVIETIEALEAFGTAGPYDRFAVARLYGGRRVRVAHGWREDGDRFESITLVSPYPDASLTQLMPGTMMIRWTTKRSTQNPQNTQSPNFSAGSAGSAFNVVTPP